jgi:hypothetical protein
MVRILFTKFVGLFILFNIAIELNKDIYDSQLIIKMIIVYTVYKVLFYASFFLLKREETQHVISEQQF